MKYVKRSEKASDQAMTQHGLSPSERFWLHVDFEVEGDACWEWVGATNNDGYGLFQLATRRKVSAHRFAFELADGPIPDGLFVLHRCDNPPCVRRSHLFLGTNSDNMRDAFKKGRLHRIGGRQDQNKALPRRNSTGPDARPVCAGDRRIEPKNSPPKE